MRLGGRCTERQKIYCWVYETHSTSFAQIEATNSDEVEGTLMTVDDNRLCVFCGKTPDTKTREHVVPYWLLEMTGDPTRVVSFGQNFNKDKAPIRYSWSQYVAPACDTCNNDYADFEARNKYSVEALLRRQALPVSAYVDLLDWLDKVRIGVWLLRHRIENHPIKITPNFHISSRVAEKDRMLAIYVFDSDNKGINLFGTDSLIFNDMPSCFGLRINDLLLLNVSSDFFCSKGCGLPHPTSMKFLQGGDNHGMLKVEGMGYAENVSNPIATESLPKPVVWLYQPIKMPSSDPMFRAGFYAHTNSYDSRIAGRTLEGNERQGALFRQLSNTVEILRHPEEMIEFDQVVGDDRARQQDIVANIYDLQISILDNFQTEWIDPTEPSEFWKEYERLKLNHTSGLADMYRNAE